jgi:ABC-type sugar transport system permease subunit
MVVSAVVIYYCIGYTGYISTLDWNGVSPEQDHVGWSNYSKLASDPVFWKALWHTAVYYVATTVGQLGMGFVFAALLHSKVVLRPVYKVIVFIPSVIAPATMAPVFRQMFSPSGQINGALDAFGLAGLTQNWLASPGTALIVVIMIQIWLSTGIAFILYYAAMGQVDVETIEAARLDGAGNLRVLRSIVWPSCRGTTVALMTLSAIASLKTFDVPYLVTGGGPNYGTEFLGTLIYRTSVPNSDVGYGAAISMVLLVLAIVAAVASFRSGREK